MSAQPIAVVTGANGFLASNLITRLKAEGWHVVKVSREKEDADHAHTLTWDALWSDEILDWASVSTVFHLAAYRPPNLEDASFADTCLEVNALLTLRFAEFVAKKSRARFIYCSAGNIYGWQEAPVKESAPIQLAHRACFYLSSKYLGEVFVERTRHSTGLNAVSFRVSSLYGSGMPENSVVARFATLARKGLSLPLQRGGCSCYDMVDVDDITELFVRAANSPVQGVFNAGSGASVSLKEIAETMNDVFENPAGWHLDGPGSNSARSGFAPLCLRSTTEAFHYIPRSFRAGVESYRRWLEERAP